MGTKPIFNDIKMCDITGAYKHVDIKLPVSPRKNGNKENKGKRKQSKNPNISELHHVHSYNSHYPPVVTTNIEKSVER